MDTETFINLLFSVSLFNGVVSVIFIGKYQQYKKELFYKNKELEEFKKHKEDLKDIIEQFRKLIK